MFVLKRVPPDHFTPIESPRFVALEPEAPLLEQVNPSAQEILDDEAADLACQTRKLSIGTVGMAAPRSTSPCPSDTRVQERHG